jgi:hypothetical protein
MLWYGLGVRSAASAWVERRPALCTGLRWLRAAVVHSAGALVAWGELGGGLLWDHRLYSHAPCEFLDYTTVESALDKPMYTVNRGI